MFRTLRPVASLLTGVALLLLGSGLLNTLVALRGSRMGLSETMLGALMSAYFVGFFVGTFAAPPLIRRIGHIRAFAFCAAACACAVLVHALSTDPVLWLALRLATGVALVGLYTVIESWLNAQAEPQQRGRVFAVYMVVNLGALAAAQQLLRADRGEPFMLFVVVALCVCAATMPVLLTRQMQPALQPTPRLRLARLFAAAPSAGVGALLSGLAMGAFWGMAPVYAARIGLHDAGVGTYMSIAVLGGAALQWPLGRLSDRRDRRFALMLVCGSAGLVALAAPELSPLSPLLSYVVIFVYGGLAFAVYPIVVAHLLDHLPPEDLLAASSSVLLLNGIGSALGPLAAGALMAGLGPDALFGWFAAMQGAIALYAAYRWNAFARARSLAPRFFPMLRTSPAVLGMIAEERTTDGTQPTREGG